MQIHELPQLATPEASNVVAVDTGTANYKVPLGNLMTNVANNLTTTESGFALDARQGKVLNDSIGSLAGNIATIETSPTVSAHTAGDYIFYNGTLYKVTDSISAGGTLTPGTNITPITVMDALIAQGSAPFLIKNITLEATGEYSTADPHEVPFTYTFSDDSTTGFTPIAYYQSGAGYQIDCFTYFYWYKAGTMGYQHDTLSAYGLSFSGHAYQGRRYANFTIVLVPDSMIR